MVELLIVDYDQLYSQLLVDGLESTGQINCVVAQSAQQAVDVLDNKSVDLIISELQLPEHNGLALLQHIQSYDDWQQLPIMLLTNVDSESLELDVELWSHYGVVDYIHKPRLDLAWLQRRIVEVANRTPAD